MIHRVPSEVHSELATRFENMQVGEIKQYLLSGAFHPQRTLWHLDREVLYDLFRYRESDGGLAPHPQSRRMPILAAAISEGNTDLAKELILTARSRLPAEQQKEILFDLVEGGQVIAEIIVGKEVDAVVACIANDWAEDFLNGGKFYGLVAGSTVMEDFHIPRGSC